MHKRINYLGQMWGVSYNYCHHCSARSGANVVTKIEICLHLKDFFGGAAESWMVPKTAFTAEIMLYGNSERSHDAMSG